MERYLLKHDKVITSQPIKGTARRDSNVDIDKKIKEDLKRSIKDHAENVMIVDLVRNDLARCCETGSIEVNELCGIYTFSQVSKKLSPSQRPYLPHQKRP
jgi:para-aminobenzoate synthetase component 1